MKIGIVANEFFDPRYGRMGGFGWVAWATALALRESGKYDPIYVTTEFSVPQGRAESHGVKLIAPWGSRASFVRRLRAEHVDLFLTVDWRPHYEKILLAEPRKRVIVWVQDPRTPFDVKRVETLTIPDQSNDCPQGTGFIDCTGLRRFVSLSRLARRPVQMASHASYLEEKLEGTYSIRNRGFEFLPDPVRLPGVDRHESGEPSVVFLGRLDPIKRPWLFFDLARRFPSVQFRVLGQPHFTGPGSWRAARAPQNVVVLGHVGEEEKFVSLRRAWVVVNTSIHEALPISFLEALSVGVPLLSMQNPEELASRFGHYVGRWNGDGRAGLDHLERALAGLLADRALRRRLGSAGSEWVWKTHGVKPFIRAFDRLVQGPAAPEAPCDLAVAPHREYARI